MRTPVTFLFAVIALAIGAFMATEAVRGQGQSGDLLSLSWEADESTFRGHSN